MKIFLKNYFNTFAKTYIFCYHRVIPKHIADAQLVHRALYVTPETFEANIKWMLSYGDIESQQLCTQPCNSPKFVITFDDGWKDCYDYAFPILKKYKCTAIIFISTGNILNRDLFWTENIGILVNYALNKNNYHFVSHRLSLLIKEILNAYNLHHKISFNSSNHNIRYLIDRYIESVKYLPQKKIVNILNLLCKFLKIKYSNDGDNLLLNFKHIRFLKKDGFQIGSHTHTHSLLDRINNNKIDYELGASKRVIEQQLQSEADLFSYPNGYYQNPYIQVSLKKHGYKYAYTLNPLGFKKQHNFYTPRFLLYEDVCKNLDLYFLKWLLYRKLKTQILNFRAPVSSKF